MRRVTTFVFVLTLLLTSCIKEEPKNAECDILEAWIDDAAMASHFYNAKDMRIGEVPSGANDLTFFVRQPSVLPLVAVNFKLTPGATITPENGSRQDFSKGPVTYTVTSEDGQWHRTYQVSFHEVTLPSNKYAFEEFELDSRGKYYVWYNTNSAGVKEYFWATGNAGYNIAKSKAAAEDYPTVPDDNGYEGKCIRLTTCETGTWGKLFQKPIAAGNFFLGSFDPSFAMTNTLKTTNMGIPYTKEPVKVTGYYKYTPGAEFTDKNMKVVEGRTDEPSIYSVLYLNKDEQGNDVMLHGDDVLSSPYIVRKAQVASLPATTKWTRFEMRFEGTTPIDPTLLANRGYNLALVFSSSKTGDTFEGAVGSTLCIDEVEISFKDE